MAARTAPGPGAPPGDMSPPGSGVGVAPESSAAGCPRSASARHPAGGAADARPRRKIRWTERTVFARLPAMRSKNLGRFTAADF